MSGRHEVRGSIPLISTTFNKPGPARKGIHAYRWAFPFGYPAVVSAFPQAGRVASSRLLRPERIVERIFVRSTSGL